MINPLDVRGERRSPVVKFDHAEALFHIKALSSPRRTGSPGEVQAQGYVIQRFKAMDMEPEEEGFSFNPVLGFLSKGFLFIVLLFITALHFLSPFYPLLRMILCLCILILALAFLWGRPIVALLEWTLFKEIPFFGKLRSKNIMATWPTSYQQSAIGSQSFESQNPIAEERHIYILAHYDSKSQTLPLGVRIPLVTILFLSTLLLSSYHLLIPLIGLQIQVMVDRVSFITALTSGLVLLWTKTRNLSPGAIDNASGVAVMLQLAETVKKDAQRFEGLKFHFVATGAEEEGLVGAFWLCKSMGAHGRTPLYFINLDGVGAKGRIYCTNKIGLHLSSQKQKAFLSLIKEMGGREGIKVYSPPVVIGAMADHFPFAAMGYSAVTFSTVSRHSLWVHSPWDTTEMVEAEGMKVVVKLILDILESLKDFKK